MAGVTPDEILRRHPYLADHADRCRSVLVFHPVLRLLSRFYGDDIAEGNRGFSVAMAILAHVCECMLTGRGGATHREILDALAPLVVAQSQAEGRPVGRPEAEALVDRVLNELQNSGEIFRAEFFDYTAGRTVTHAFRILEAEAARERGAYKIKLTPAGIDLFFRLKEVYGALDTDMERLFLEHQVKRGCYAEAGRVVDTLLLKITRALEAHRELRGKLRSNPAEVSADEVEYFGTVVAERLREEKDHFARIRDLIESQMRSLLRQWNRRGPKDPVIQENLAALRELRAGTARVVDRHNLLFGLNTELRREFRRLKLGLLTFAPTLRRLPMEAEVLDRVLGKDLRLPEVHRFLGPVLGPRARRWFHLAQMFPPGRAQPRRPRGVVPRGPLGRPRVDRPGAPADRAARDPPAGAPLLPGRPARRPGGPGRAGGPRRPGPTRDRRRRAGGGRGARVPHGHGRGRGPGVPAVLAVAPQPARGGAPGRRDPGGLRPAGGRGARLGPVRGRAHRGRGGLVRVGREPDPATPVRVGGRPGGRRGGPWRLTNAAKPCP